MGRVCGARIAAVRPVAGSDDKQGMNEPRPKKLKPEPGAYVRLLRDVHTRGGVIFRAGLRMQILNDVGEFYLRVVVRGRRHYLKLCKKDQSRYFEVTTPAAKEDDE